MPFFSESFTSTLTVREGDKYLNPSGLEDGTSVRFHILSSEPLTGHEVWLVKGDGKKTKRVLEAQPTADDLAELCAELKASVDERDGRQAIRPCAAFFVWDYDAAAVRLFSASQATVLKELGSITSDPDYEDLSQWDLKLSRTGKGKDTAYKLLPLPTKRSGAVAREIEAGWAAALKAGADLRALCTGDDPLPAA